MTAIREKIWMECLAGEQHGNVICLFYQKKPTEIHKYLFSSVGFYCKAGITWEILMIGIIVQSEEAVWLLFFFLLWEMKTE